MVDRRREKTIRRLIKKGNPKIEIEKGTEKGRILGKNSVSQYLLRKIFCGKKKELFLNLSKLVLKGKMHFSEKKKVLKGNFCLEKRFFLEKQKVLLANKKKTLTSFFGKGKEI